MFQTQAEEKIETHFMFNNGFLEIRAVYGIMWKNILERCRPQMVIRRMRIPCSITKATDTHSEYVIFTARTRLDVTLFVRCLSGCVFMVSKNVCLTRKEKKV